MPIIRPIIGQLDFYITQNAKFGPIFGTDRIDERIIVIVEDTSCAWQHQAKRLHLKAYLVFAQHAV
jgi:hypothetical protein